jgi:hypothetical protein
MNLSIRSLLASLAVSLLLWPGVVSAEPSSGPAITVEQEASLLGLAVDNDFQQALRNSVVNL